ncbi:hypothetical protein NHQ30_006770 [Ciborinia camelliae]|nr:hypothetical protein NHQ30_006770 [Ciborinia camelliae]
MAKPTGVSKDGFEIQFATNQLGHSLLVRKLLPLLEKTASQPGADVRIIMVTSLAFKGALSGGIQFDKLQTEKDLPMLGSWLRYDQSKLANLLCRQDFLGQMLTPEQGTYNLLCAVTAKREEIKSGGF